MTWSINTNTSSLYAQQGLASAQSGLSSTIQQLSTGLRVNSAADNPAGYAISIKMSAAINGMNQAVHNANDGISLVQTGQSALSNITGMLQTMRTLSVQASTGTYSSTDLGNLNSEFSALASQIDNVANSTSFNGNKIFGGSAIMIQVGADTQTTSSLTLSSTALAAVTSLANGPFSATSTNTSPLTSASGPIAAADAAALNAITALGGTTPSVAAMSAFNAALEASANIAIASGVATAATAATPAAASAALAAGAATALALFSAAANGTSGATTAAFYTMAVAAGVGAAAATGALAATGDFGIALTNIAIAGAPPASVSTATAASAALATIDTELSTLSSQAAQLGAYQIQLSSVVSNLQANVTNTSNAQGQIQDVDYADRKSVV